MVNHIETVEEKVRNKLTPFYNLITLLQCHNIVKNEGYDINLFDLVLNDDKFVKILHENCDFLIKLSNIVDKHLPEGFDVNKEMEK